MDNYPDLDFEKGKESRKDQAEKSMEKAFLVVTGGFILFGGYLYLFS